MRKYLSAAAVAKLKKPGRYAVGDNCYLQISKWNTRAWVYRYTHNGQAHHMGLGPYRLVTLAEARSKAREAARSVLDGVDPLEAKRRARRASLLAGVKDKTFRQCAEAYIAAHETTWRHPKHHHQWNASLAQYVYPIIGDLSVAAMDVGLVLQVLEPIWKTRTETASRVRGRIEAILDWARVHKLREGENPARWRGHLKHLLPEKFKLRKVIHHPALPYAEINGFMADLRKQGGIVARALEFAILTAARKSEVTGARWSEIDGNVWTIPGERMKGGRNHRVPVCDCAVAILKGLPREGDFVFIGAQSGRPIGDAAMPDLLERMGRDDVTVHGFRSTFKDWASETTAYPNHVVEMALAHAVGNGVEKAYRRGDLFEKRRALMQDWARYCGGK